MKLVYEKDGKAFWAVLVWRDFKRTRKVRIAHLAKTQIELQGFTLPCWQAEYLPRDGTSFDHDTIQRPLLGDVKRELEARLFVALVGARDADEQPPRRPRGVAEPLRDGTDKPRPAA